MPFGLGEDTGVLPKATLPKLRLEVIVSAVEDVERVFFISDEIHGLRPIRLSGQYDIPKTLSVRQLAEHQHGKLVPAGEVLDVFITIVFL